MRIGQCGRLAALATVALGVGLVGAAPSFANHQTVTGLTNEDPSRIVQFAVGAPGTLLGGATPVAISGLSATDNNDNLVGLDYRPRTGTLYGVGSGGQVYLLTPGATVADPFTATAIGTPAADPITDGSGGVDFNPVPDAIRVNNVADQNFRFNPNTGAIAGAPDTNLAFDLMDANAGDNPVVGGAAYSRNFDGTTQTTLYDIEAGNNALVRQGGIDVPPGTPSPNGGLLFTVGTLPGGDITDTAGFDIETQTGNAYAALQSTGDPESVFYRLDLANGSALNTFGQVGPDGTPPIDGASLVPTALLGFANAITSVSEAGPTASVTVTRTGSLARSATVNYATELAAGDTAQAADFTATTGTLTFAPGDATETLTVPIANDTTDESDERFTVRLSMPSTSVNLPSPATAQVNIVDNDDAPAGKPNAAPIGLISVPSQKIDSSIVATYACDEACAASLELKLGGKSLDTQASSLTAAGTKGVTFALSASEVKAVKKKAKGKRSAKLSIAGTFSDANGANTSVVKFRLG